MQNDNNDSQQLLDRYKTDIKEVKDDFIKTIRFSQSLIIILNSGGVVALVDFFTNHQNPPAILIKLTAIFFVLGIIFGILTLFCDFLTGYFLFGNLLKIRTEELLNEYYSCKEEEKRFNKLLKGLYTLVAFGFISPILWLFGVACIFDYILNAKCPILIIICFFLFISGLGCILFYLLRSKIEWNSEEN